MLRKIYRTSLAFKNSIFTQKIFCISFQKTGTTSVGQFFKDHGFRVATWRVARKNQWPKKWSSGDFENIFKANDFKIAEVFEDTPWWYPGFYKVLFHRFPKAKFILLERDADKWFDSMANHEVKGKNPDNTYRHSRVFRREKEFDDHIHLNQFYTNEIDNRLPLDEGLRPHYTELYRIKNREVRNFFNEFDPSRLFYAKLENEYLWQELGEFFKIEVPSGYQVHKNKS